MTSKTLPTPEYLRKRLRYEPETGKLFWLDCDDMRPQWKSRFVGKEAMITMSSHGYFSARFSGCAVYAHRVIWAMVHGEWPVGEIDHINGNRSDNRIENLRHVTKSENAKNKRRPSNNSSGVSGVHWFKRDQKWQAQISIGSGRSKHLGYFSTLEEAAAARLAAEREYGYTDRHGKEPAVRYGVK